MPNVYLHAGPFEVLVVEIAIWSLLVIVIVPGVSSLRFGGSGVSSDSPGWARTCPCVSWMKTSAALPGVSVTRKTLSVPSVTKVVGAPGTSVGGVCAAAETVSLMCTRGEVGPPGRDGSSDCRHQRECNRHTRDSSSVTGSHVNPWRRVKNCWKCSSSPQRKSLFVTVAQKSGA